MLQVEDTLDGFDELTSSGRLSEASLSATFVATTGAPKIRYEDDQHRTDAVADYTPKIDLWSWQSPHNVSGRGDGSPIRINVAHQDAKGLILWRLPINPKQPYDAATNPMKDALWLSTHWLHKESGAVHGHFSIEAPDATGALQTRFELKLYDPIADPTGNTIGSDKIYIATANSDFIVRSGGVHGVLRIAGNSTDEKAFEWTTEWSGNNSRRWRQVVDSTASDNHMRFERWAGATLTGTALTLSRTSNKATFGSADATLGGTVNAVWSAASQAGFNARPTASPGTGGAFKADMFTSTDRALDVLVQGDTVSRLVVTADGAHNWGSGSATRDTNLYRKAADTLATDDDFELTSSSKGLILTDGSGGRWRVKVNSSGVLTVDAA